MVRNVTFTDASRKFQSLSGLETLTVADKFFLLNSFNRSALEAYHESNLWPRFLRVGEERSLSSEPISNVTYTYPTEIQIGDMPYIYGTTDTVYRSSFSASFILNDIYELGKNINSMPAWYGSPDRGSVSYDYVIALGADTVRYGLYTIGDNGLSSDPVFFFDYDSENIILPTASIFNNDLYVFDFSTQTASPADNSIFQFTYGGSTSSQSTVLADNVIPYTELNKDEIGEFIRIHADRPYNNLGTYEYDFYVDSNGANIMNLDEGTQSAYITYKKSYNPSFTEESSDIPQEFLDYMLFTALGDFYTGDGQTENAAVAYNRAEQSLSSELFRLEQKNNRNVMGFKIATHHTRQLR